MAVQALPYRPKAVAAATSTALRTSTLEALTVFRRITLAPLLFIPLLLQLTLYTQKKRRGRSSPNSQQWHEAKTDGDGEHLVAAQVGVSQLPRNDLHHGHVQKRATGQSTQRCTPFAIRHLRASTGKTHVLRGCETVGGEIVHMYIEHVQREQASLLDICLMLDNACRPVLVTCSSIAT